MNLQGMRVTVVGGAIAGASTALALARAGAQVTMLERSPAARAVGAGIALAANGLAVLKALGIEVEASPLAGVRVVDGRGRTLFEPRNAELRMVRRSALYARLAEAIARSGVEARYGEELSELGAIEADLVVGADGVHSRVRTVAGFEARVRKSGIAYARGLAPAGLARNEEAWTSAGLFGSFDVPDGTYWYASLGKVPRPELMRAVWAKAYPASEPILRASANVLINDVIEVSLASYVRGSVALVGDAAHAMAPNLGQGANSALVDALVLSDELRRSVDLKSALRAYDLRRRPRVAKVAQTAARLGKLAELSHPVLRFLRDRVLMPLASGGDNTRMVLQEDPAQLAICASSS